jgi:hypothetical protein
MAIQLVEVVIKKLTHYNFKFKNNSDTYLEWINENISSLNYVDEEYNIFMQNYQKLNPMAQTNYIFSIVYAICYVENKMQYFDTYFRLVVV